MKLQRISLVAALCLVASVVASPVPKEEKRVAKPHHAKRNALGKRGYEKDYYGDDYYYDDDYDYSYSYDDDYYYEDDYDYSYSYDDDYYYDDYDYYGSYGKGKSSYKKRDAAPKPLKFKTMSLDHFVANGKNLIWPNIHSNKYKL
ncbi:hypothetical protein C2G38_2031857 [Gigaspora rosea]|uniref:Secreted protein n=1 Tax=Gigaspora rosea TaxID=44941 RepID=A0A397VSW8_9GLOM|nr:hypothetical protein C2G38_2031857 [Gigaspora rosea]